MTDTHDISITLLAACYHAVSGLLSRCYHVVSGLLPRLAASVEFAKSIASKHALKHQARPPQIKQINKHTDKQTNKFCLDSNDLGLVYAGINIVSGYIRDMRPDLICFGTNILPF